MAFTFEQLFAADPANPSNIAQNADIVIFAPGDATQTPLTITDPSGSALSNPIPVNANGFGSAFAHETLDRVAWAGGGFTGFLTSYDGIKTEAVAARTAAETAEAAATTAGADAAAEAAAALAGAVAAAEAAATSAADAAALVGAPADTAIAAAVAGNGATKTALKSAILTERNVFTQPARGAVMFSLDDNYGQNAELVAVHDALGQKITLAITSDWVDDPGKLTSAQNLAFHNAGHEIANHSKSHANYVNSTAAVRATESDTCSQFIYDLTGRWPSTFLYPQGAWNATTDQELYTRFRSWALTCSAGTNAPLTYPLYDTFPRFYRLDLDSPANLDRAKELVRMAAYSPIVVSFYTHWTDQPGTLTRLRSISPSRSSPMT